jgi:hypothetical protein
VKSVKGALGKVNLNDVVHSRMADADKNLPTEAAHQLRAIVEQTYGQGSRIPAQQVSTLLKHLKINDDNIHCVEEKKLKRKYITRAGIAAVAGYIKQHPVEALRVFGSKAPIERYKASALCDLM